MNLPKIDDLRVEGSCPGMKFGRKRLRICSDERLDTNRPVDALRRTAGINQENIMAYAIRFPGGLTLPPVLRASLNAITRPTTYVKIAKYVRVDSSTQASHN